LKSEAQVWPSKIYPTLSLQNDGILQNWDWGKVKDLSVGCQTVFFLVII